MDGPPPALPRPETSSVARPGLQSSAPKLKRKADDDLSKQNIKVWKENSINSKTSSGLALANLKVPPKTPRPTVATSPTTLSVPYRGTGKVGQNVASPTTPGSDTPKAPPKKGSYAEIMARAKTASETVKSTVGVIKHRPRDAVSMKKEILLQKKGLKKRPSPDPRDGLRHGMSANKTGPQSTTNLGAKNNPESRPRRKTLSPPAYRGTAAPIKRQSSYKGTMKPARSPGTLSAGRKNSAPADSRLARSRSTSMGRRVDRSNRYLSEDEEDILNEEDEFGDGGREGGYEESSDDMEAGFSDVEEEETIAAKTAKKEDEEQLRIELQMKREKGERKRKLEQLAKNAKQRNY